MGSAKNGPGPKARGVHEARGINKEKKGTKGLRVQAAEAARREQQRQAQLARNYEQAKTCRFVAVNARGHRIGEAHPGAILTDHDVDLLLDLHGQGGVSLAWLADKFEVSKSCVHKIVSGKHRSQTIERVKRVRTGYPPPAELLTLRAAGWTLARIAEHLHLHASTVSRLCVLAKTQPDPDVHDQDVTERTSSRVPANEMRTRVRNVAKSKPQR